LNHDYIGDLIATLTSPHGTTVMLMNRPGPGLAHSSGKNFCNTIFIDNATNSIQAITGAGAPYTGSYIPYQPLSAFIGEDPNGTWTLNVSDNSATDTGNVRAFSLRLFGRQCCSANGDSVGDGIPDAWRLQYFGSGTTTNNRSCAACDPDGDGMNNLQEYLAGTVPTNSASSFRITAIVRTNNDLRVTWQTVAGKTNALERAPTALTNFAAIFTATNTAAGTTNYLDVGAATNSPGRYYRVRLVP
jgi:subtilisin-like proprotein convertase family protein